MLYVVSNGNNEVLQYNGSTGASVNNPFVSSGSGGLANPYGMAFGPNGNLFVAPNANSDVSPDPSFCRLHKKRAH